MSANHWTHYLVLLFLTASGFQLWRLHTRCKELHMKGVNNTGLVAVFLHFYRHSSFYNMILWLPSSYKGVHNLLLLHYLKFLCTALLKPLWTRFGPPVQDNSSCSTVFKEWRSMILLPLQFSGRTDVCHHLLPTGPSAPTAWQPLHQSVKWTTSGHTYGWHSEQLCEKVRRRLADLSHGHPRMRMQWAATCYSPTQRQTRAGAFPKHGQHDCVTTKVTLNPKKVLKN